jgi:hypothetical protein
MFFLLFRTALVQPGGIAAAHRQKSLFLTHFALLTTHFLPGFIYILQYCVKRPKTKTGKNFQQKKKQIIGNDPMIRFFLK